MKWDRNFSMNEVFRRWSALSLEPNRLVVWTFLMSFTNATKSEVWPSVAVVSKGTGLNERTVRRALKDLAKAGLIRALPGAHTADNHNPVHYDMKGVVDVAARLSGEAVKPESKPKNVDVPAKAPVVPPAKVPNLDVLALVEAQPEPKTEVVAFARDNYVSITNPDVCQRVGDLFLLQEQVRERFQNPEYKLVGSDELDALMAGKPVWHTVLDRLERDNGNVKERLAA